MYLFSMFKNNLRTKLGTYIEAQIAKILRTMSLVRYLLVLLAKEYWRISGKITGNNLIVCEPHWLGNCSGCVYWEFVYSMSACMYFVSVCESLGLFVTLCLHVRVLALDISSGRPIIRLPAIPRCRMLADRCRNTYLRTIHSFFIRNLSTQIALKVS